MVSEPAALQTGAPRKGFDIKAEKGEGKGIGVLVVETGSEPIPAKPVLPDREGPHVEKGSRSKLVPTLGITRSRARLGGKKPVTEEMIIG